MVLAIAPEDELSYVEAFREELGLTMPVLFDEHARVHRGWDVEQAYEDTYYPQDYLIDPDGDIVYVSNHYEPERLSELIDGMLAAE